MRVAAADLETLSGTERLGLAFARRINGAVRLQRTLLWLNRNVHRRALRLCSQRRIHVLGADQVAALRPDRGVLLASNHRSFFDQYLITTYLLDTVDIWRRWFFPVRSGFFYDSPVGILVNLLASSCTMYPPIFRPRPQRGVTRASLDFLAEQLQLPDTLVGIHPEGTRGKGPDPYELLPAEPGFGRVVLQAWPIVLPVFVNGMGNNPLREAVHNFGGSGPPIIIAFGDPVDLSAFEGQDPHLLRNQVKVSRRVLEDVARLAEEERGLRQELVATAAQAT